jgi:hypothetical protein
MSTPNSIINLFLSQMGQKAIQKGFCSIKPTLFTLHPLRIEMNEEEKYGGLPGAHRQRHALHSRQTLGVKSEAKTPAGCPDGSAHPG